MIVQGIGAGIKSYRPRMLTFGSSRDVNFANPTQEQQKKIVQDLKSFKRLGEHNLNEYYEAPDDCHIIIKYGVPSDARKEEAAVSILKNLDRESKKIESLKFHYPGILEKIPLKFPMIKWAFQDDSNNVYACFSPVSGASVPPDGFDDTKAQDLYEKCLIAYNPIGINKYSFGLGFLYSSYEGGQFDSRLKKIGLELDSPYRESDLYMIVQDSLLSATKMNIVEKAKELKLPPELVAMEYQAAINKD